MDVIQQCREQYGRVAVAMMVKLPVVAEKTNVGFIKRY